MMPGTTENPVLGPGGGGLRLRQEGAVPFVEAMALQLAPRFIRVQAVHPTNTNTHLLHHEDLYRVFRPTSSRRRAGRRAGVRGFPGDADPVHRARGHGRPVLFLASDESKYITGHHIRVDVGSLLKIPGSESVVVTAASPHRGTP